MKILHVVENLNRGGLERTVVDLATLQKRNNHDIKVLCIMNKGTLAQELEEIGIQVTPIDKDASGLITSFRKIRCTLKKFQPDVIHTHNPMANYFVVIAAIGMKRINIVNTRHGMGQYWKSKKGKVLYLLSQLKTRFIVAVCETAKDMFVDTKQITLSKCITIKNGIKSDEFLNFDVSFKNKLCDVLNIPYGHKLLGTVGRLNYVKNHHFLIEAFSQLHQNEEDTHLLIIGDGEMRCELKEKVRVLNLDKAIHFLGDRSDVHSLLSALDIFVLTSISEGFSIALLEACASRLPIIATDVGGNKEIVQHGKTGLLIPSNDIEALVSAMTNLINNQSLSEEFGAQAYDWLIKEASLEVMFERYMQLYKEAINPINMTCFK